MFIRQVLLKLKSASAGAFGRPVFLFWFICAALIAPIALVSLAGEPNNLPWYFWAAAISLVLGVMSIGFWMFARKRSAAEDISISPDRKAR
jgi:hypothetical protein